jgi:3-methyladenine DNA glycosylase AlkC
MITKLADLKAEMLEGRRDPLPLLLRLRVLAASESWQEREVAATALVELSKRHAGAVLTAAWTWAHDTDVNVRRAASEGLRRLVQHDPGGARPVLESLREDTELYVKKSVANVLRNATRTQSDFVLELCAEWARSSNADTRWIVHDGLRKMRTVRPSDADRVLALLAAPAGRTPR